MGGKKTTIYERVSAFKSELMYVFEDDGKPTKIMMCRCCNTRVDWTRKSTIDNHCASSTHKIAKAKYSKDKNNAKQTSIASAVRQVNKLKEEKQDFIKSTVRAFMSANIPLHKLRHPKIRDWMNKQIKGAGDLPSVQWIRKTVVPEIKAEEESTLKDALVDQEILVQCGESTDRRGRAVFIVLFRILSKNSATPPKLVVARVKELTAANAQQCSQTIVEVVNKYDVKYENIKGIVSDSAKYMTSCVTTLKGIIGEHLQHIQCWSHKLDKLEKIAPETFKRLNEFVKKTKKVFKNTRKRRHRYMTFLEDKYKVSKAKTAKLFPMPVMNRWNSWKASSDYVEEYADDLVEYIAQLPEDVAAVKYFKALKEEDLLIVKAEAAFVKEHGSAVSDLLLLLEGNSYPLAHKLYPALQDLLTANALFKSCRDVKTVVGNKTKEALNLLPRGKRANVEDRIKAYSKQCFDRLTALMAGDPSRKFYESVATLFHPVKMLSTSAEGITKSLKELAIFKDTPVAQLQVLHGILREHVKTAVSSQGASPTPGTQTDIVLNVLTGMLATANKDFAGKCLNLIFFSVSNVDCERAFSSYGDIVSPKRCSTQVKNAELSMYMHFGDKEGENSSDEFDENMNLDTEPDNSEEMDIS